MHIPTSVRKVSPTAIGLMSGAQPSLFLFRAIRLPPAKNRDTELGAFPAASILMTDLRDEHMGVGRGMLATSSRCWTRKPEGPAAVSLGNDCRTERMLKSGCSVIVSVDWTTGTTGAGQLGCFAFKSCHVFSLFGAIRIFVQ